MLLKEYITFNMLDMVSNTRCFISDLLENEDFENAKLPVKSTNHLIYGGLDYLVLEFQHLLDVDN